MRAKLRTEGISLQLQVQVVSIFVWFQYTGMEAHVLCFGSLSRKFDTLQRTGQGRLLALFMYKVYINGLLTELTSHSCAPSVNNLSLPSPSFADDTSLLSIYPSFLNIFMQICYDYSLKWRYEFNHSKSGVVAFGETRLVPLYC